MVVSYAPRSLIPVSQPKSGQRRRIDSELNHAKNQSTRSIRATPMNCKRSDTIVEVNLQDKERIYMDIESIVVQLRQEARETLIKLSFFHRECSYEVSADEAEDTGDDEWIRALQQEDAAGLVSGRDGTGGALGASYAG